MLRFADWASDCSMVLVGSVEPVPVPATPPRPTPPSGTPPPAVVAEPRPSAEAPPLETPGPSGERLAVPTGAPITVDGEPPPRTAAAVTADPGSALTASC